MKHIRATPALSVLAVLIIAVLGCCATTNNTS
jgi:type IV pilus biogenesis protein CpaD/CtpE